MTPVYKWRCTICNSLTSGNQHWMLWRKGETTQVAVCFPCQDKASRSQQHYASAICLAKRHRRPKRK